MSIRVKRMRSFLAVLLSILMVLALPGPRLVRADETPLVKKNSADITIDNEAYGDYWTLKVTKEPEPPFNQTEYGNDVRVLRTQPWFYKAQHGAYGELKDAWMAGNCEGAPAYNPPLADDEKGPIKLWERTGVSNIGFTVTGTGNFYFEYRATPSGRGANPPDGGDQVRHGIYAKINEPVTWANANDNVFRSVDNQLGPLMVGSNLRPGWLDETIVIGEGDLIDGQATIYIANLRATHKDGNDNDCAIANVAFYPDETPDFNLNLKIEGNTYGSVAVGDTDYSDANQVIPFSPGSPVSLTANANEGGQFFGWKDEEGKFISTDADRSFIMTEDKTVKAFFGPEGYFVVSRNDEYFYTLADGGLYQAIEEAEPGDFIYLLGDYELDSNLTVPQNVTLYVPFRDSFKEGKWLHDGDKPYYVEDKKGYADGTSAKNSHFTASMNLASVDKTFRTLTIDEDVTLTVNGTLLVGSVISYPSQYYQGHTSGWHGRIINSGDIIIKSGGKLDSFGIITGSGRVKVESGGEAYEPFMVLDWPGGSNAEQLFKVHQSPFKQYAMQNIQVNLEIQPGGSLFAHCNIYAGSGYNKIDIVYVGTDGLFDPASGASCTRTFEQKPTLRDPDVGITTYTYDGGMVMNPMVLDLAFVEVGMDNLEFPIPQSMNLVFKNGTYDPGRTKLMPGAVMRVEEGAHLVVTDTLFVLDGLIESAMGAERIYHSTGDLQDKGYDGAGLLYVDGSMTVKNGARFGGVIQTGHGETPANLVFEAGAELTNEGVIDGAVGFYEQACNLSTFDLPARAYIYDRAEKTYALQELTAGTSYRSYDASNWEIADYTMVYAKHNGSPEGADSFFWPRDGEGVSYYVWDTATVDLNEDRTGSWSLPFGGYTVNVTKRTTSNPSDDSKAVINVVEEIEEGKDLLFTVGSTEAGAGYVHLVTYTMGGGDPVELAPVNGEYTISDVQGEISIQVTSCKLGDLTGDDKVTNSDLLKMTKIILKIDQPTSIQKLSGDFNEDGKITTSDLLRVKRIILKFD